MLEHTRFRPLLGPECHAHRMRGEGHYSIFISYAGTDAFGRVLKELRFVYRGGIHSLVAHLTKDAPADIADAVQEKENWFIFDGEMDL